MFCGASWQSDTRHRSQCSPGYVGHSPASRLLLRATSLFHPSTRQRRFHFPLAARKLEAGGFFWYSSLQLTAFPWWDGLGAFNPVL